MEPVRQILAVLAVLGLLGGTLYWLRTKGAAQFAVKGFGRAANRKMRLVEQLRLTPHHSLHLVNVQGRMLLVAVSPQGCSVLTGGEVEVQTEDRTVSR